VSEKRLFQCKFQRRNETQSAAIAGASGSVVARRLAENRDAQVLLVEAGGDDLCRRCETEASIPLEHVRRPRDTPIWKLEASLKCRSCRQGRYAPPVVMIRLSEERQTLPYVWVHPDEER
jgi:choline dehydrogenase-like flavoprotein